MKVLGVTGGIGSGKSTVSRILGALGMPIIDADKLARDAVAPGTAALDAIRAEFGDTLFLPSGELDRRQLGSLVFADANARKTLESIVHPQIADRYDAALRGYGQEGHRWLVYDVPLLFEHRLEHRVSRIAVVWASLPVRQKRLSKREPPLSLPEIDARIAAQMPLEDKLRRADYKIDNDGSIDDTERRVRTLFAMLMHSGEANAQ